MAKTCRVCHARGETFLFTLMAGHKDRRRQWLIEVCQGCWRVFECMLDEAMVGRQPSLWRDGEMAPFLV